LAALGLVETYDDTSGWRFSMLPTIQAFAVWHARDAGFVETATARHADYFRRWVADLQGDLAAASTTVQHLRADGDNLRVALEWFAQHDAPTGLALAIDRSDLDRDSPWHGQLDPAERVDCRGSRLVTAAVRRGGCLPLATTWSRRGLRRVDAPGITAAASAITTSGRPDCRTGPTVADPGPTPGGGHLSGELVEAPGISDRGQRVQIGDEEHRRRLLGELERWFDHPGVVAQVRGPRRRDPGHHGMAPLLPASRPISRRDSIGTAR
jgi:hypothetical protein